MKKVILDDLNKIIKIVKNSNNGQTKSQIKEIYKNINNYPNEIINYDKLIDVINILDITNKDLNNLKFDVLLKTMNLCNINTIEHINWLIKFIFKNKNLSHIFLIKWIQLLQNLIKNNWFKITEEKNIKDILKIIISVISENKDNKELQNLFCNFIIQYFYNFYKFIIDCEDKVKYEKLLVEIFKELYIY